MIILYRVKRTNRIGMIDSIKYVLEKDKLPYYWITENDETKRSFCSKGLDYQVVFIVNFDSMPFPLEEDREREVSLLYIAMTRAKEYLCLSYLGETEFTKYFDNTLKERRKKKELKLGRID